MDITTITLDGAKLIRLYVSAPIDHKTLTSERVFWQHAKGCNGNIFIGDDASCFCDKCNTRSHIRNWRLFFDNLSENEQDDTDKLSTQVSVSNCTAMAGEMVKECGITWLKSFLDGLSKYTPNLDSCLVMQPYQQTEQDEVPDSQQIDDTHAFESSYEENLEVTNSDHKTEYTESSSTDETISEEMENPEVFENQFNEERVDNLDIDISSFDESTFFERFSKKNSK